ncbi:two-component system sensor histidine kinase NtrB [Actinoplanes regularis]|uniref:two-component system sensor histidine kinase NtrB n=1 Tax=Actinoplanes regularis TaxID=52697 RepID=UPI0024A4A042|nr:ATP-binding protein [Actinoplanes regularis]GLW33213.1 hypothetical protein Areg01_61510 [Actinoplanes regularis]
MARATLWLQRWLRGANTMLGLVRTLFIAVLVPWPVYSLWALYGAGWMAVAGSASALLLTGWLCLGYRRQRFPAWSWIAEGACVCVIAASSGYAAIGLCFKWVNFRGLYGPRREKYLAAAVLAVIAVLSMRVSEVEPADAVPLLCTGLVSLVVTHMLAEGCSVRDRSAHRKRTLALAGSGLVASATRAEAMEVTTTAALRMDQAVSAVVILTIARPALRVAAAAGRLGAETSGLVTELARLPAEIRAALRPGGYVTVDGAAAAEAVDLLRLPRNAVVAVAPMSSGEAVFGMLVLALEQPPADDLAEAVTALADRAALTLDQLLSRTRLSIVVEHSADALILAGEAGAIRFVNPAAAALLGCRSSELLGRSVWQLMNDDDAAKLRAAESAPGPPMALQCRIRGHDGAAWAEVEAKMKYVTEHDGSRSIVFTAHDVSERQRLELELRHAQKLESVGRLAAGIAHEINTPIQFVGDNLRFLDSAFADLGRMCAAYRELLAAGPEPGAAEEARRRIDDTADEIDLEFVLEEAPAAVAQALEGIGRVAHIVRAMKAFGHPGTEEKSTADLNEAIRNTLVVAANEIKFVADVETDYGDLPLVKCHLGDINQVVLNLVVNAAHAIGSADRGRGTIRVSTRLDDGCAVIEVADTGTGVAPEIADRLFDPFFTTKEVGSGTGQGLAMVRTLVADRHGGTIDFTSVVGEGTVFTVRLPLADDDDLRADPAEAVDVG